MPILNPDRADMPLSLAQEDYYYTTAKNYASVDNELEIILLNLF